MRADCRRARSLAPPLLRGVFLHRHLARRRTVSRPATALMTLAFGRYYAYGVLGVRPFVMAPYYRPRAFGSFSRGGFGIPAEVSLYSANSRADCAFRSARQGSREIAASSKPALEAVTPRPLRASGSGRHTPPCFRLDFFLAGDTDTYYFAPRTAFLGTPRERAASDAASPQALGAADDRSTAALSSLEKRKQYLLMTKRARCLGSTWPTSCLIPLLHHHRLRREVP